MLIHVTPRIINKYRDLNVKLIDVEIPEINCLLKEGSDLTVGKPYPNKMYTVIRKKVGRKAINGIFLDIPDTLDDFTVITRWKIDNEHIVSHQVKYEIKDKQHDFSSDDPVLWYATGDGKFESAWTSDDKTPCNYHPHMTVQYKSQDDSREGEVFDEYQGDWLVSRREIYPLPSLPRDRIFCEYNMHLDRMPQPEDAFSQNTGDLL